MEKSRLFLIPDSDLAQAGVLLEEKLATAADSVTPRELPAVLDGIMRHCIDWGIARVAADEGSVWLIDPERESLVVSHNTHDPDFVWFRQPLDSGIISMVVATEQPSCENDVHNHRKFAGEADRKVGKTTGAMIVVPLYYGGSLRGVVSCVQHLENHDGKVPGFNSEHLSEFEFVAELLGRLIDDRLSRRLLGIEG